ncbi:MULTISPECIES: hypothetical protein [Niastella]|uniref:Uncharacterized protein n=1 Tax=Niastella soli TaxID=2821487 RepID=A0ABS3YZN9_9BACT|nr:hypothetical protein [Niastella soli]MBO9203392.1 hypothetical protein [Niastella soli]
MSGQKKTGSIFMLDVNGNRANEMLSSLLPNELIIKANRSFIFFLRSPLNGLVSHGEETSAGFQRVLADRIKNRLYSYYSINDNGAIDDSATIKVDSNFLIEYKEPLVTD